MVDDRATPPWALASAGDCPGQSAAEFRRAREVVFSIAVPVLGQTRFLPDAFNSIAAQAVPLQVAVMDATPGDGVQRIIERHRERIHYSRHGPDAGQSAAIREGWGQTTGDVVGWLCADDCLFPGALAQVADVFLRYPDVDVVYGDGIFIDQDGRFIRYFPAISEDVGRLAWVNCITQPSCFVRRAAMEYVGGVRADLHYTMDWDLWVRLLLAGCRFHYLRTPLSASRMHQGTKTTSGSVWRMMEIWRHLVKHNALHRAIRSMVGLTLTPVMYPEAGAARKTAASACFRRAIGAARRMWIPRGSSAANVLYGLETGTNTARSRCEIVLPYLGDRAPTRLLVCTSENVGLKASVGGAAAVCGAVKTTSSQHVFPINVASGRQTLRFELKATTDDAWRLLSAHLE